MTWIQTYTGKRFDLLDIDIEQIDIFDIAHALANTCRFAGHCRTFYSVAQHSIHVSYLVPHEHARVALMHDAAEAYLTDIPAPFKQLMPDYQVIEQHVWSAIARRFDLPSELPAEVKRADLVALATERRDLLKRTNDRWPILDGVRSDAAIRIPVSPETAKRAFLRRFGDLQPKWAEL